MISQQSIQQIVSRIDIVEIIGSFVKLKKRGSNYIGLCPFHDERTPSFMVSPTKEIYKCFGCGRSGNAIGFLMDHEKYSYVEAIRWLAARYNVELEETQSSPEARLQQQVAESLFIINNFAREFFSRVLVETDEGRSIGLGYFRERGFSDDTIAKFQLGYCPESSSAFSSAALKAGYKLEYLLKTGLVVMRQDQPVDNYRGRVIFPVHNQSGKIIGFGARILKANDRAPKYINTPENELYVKSRLLYGTYFARQAMDRQDECLLVEGYTDVISLHQAGIENVVASGGTSLTPDQLRLIRKFTGNLTILYDGDSAGIRAALRGLDLALEEGLNVKLALIPDNEDPDSYVRKVGAAAFREFIAREKKDFIVFMLQVSLKEAGNDPQKKSQLVNQIAETIARIHKLEDFTRQQDYIHQCSQMLGIDENGLVALVNRYIREKVRKEGQIPADEARQLEQEATGDNHPSDEFTDLLLRGDEKQEEGLVRVLLEFGQMDWDDGKKVADHIFEAQIDFDLLENQTAKRIIEHYRTLYHLKIYPDAKTFVYHEDPEISSYSIHSLEFPYEVSPNWKVKFELDVPTRNEMYRQDVQSVLIWLSLAKIKKLIAENQKEWNHAGSFEDQVALMQLHSHLKKMEKELTEKLGTVIYK
ncbi:MAG TPA: DNA primase [Chitinophagaceae bacterium]|nr:DNA primase [Chitinophagaceae bacterium]